MKTVKMVTLAFSVVGMVVVAPATQAVPVQFDIANATFSGGVGYGSNQGQSELENVIHSDPEVLTLRFRSSLLFR